MTDGRHRTRQITDRVVRLTALPGGSDEHQNGFSEAEILDSLDVIES